MKNDPNEKNIPNTFLPLCDEKVFSVKYLTGLLRHGCVSLDRMPKDVAEKVENELSRRGKIWRNTLSRSQHSHIVNSPGED